MERKRGFALRCRVAPRAEHADGQGRDGGPERLIRGEDAVIPVAVPAWWRDEIGESIEELNPEACWRSRWKIRRIRSFGAATCFPSVRSRRPVW
jgi:hypothetical protein